MTIEPCMSAQPVYAQMIGRGCRSRVSTPLRWRALGGSRFAADGSRTRAWAAVNLGVGPSYGFAAIVAAAVGTDEWSTFIPEAGS